MSLFSRSRRLLLALYAGTTILAMSAAPQARALSPEDVPFVARSAERGNDASQVLLGIAYINGDAGLARNPAFAARWFELAALEGNAYAQERIADLYEAGQGVPANLALAFDWRLKAAKRGNLVAQVKLARMYRMGAGTAPNADEARGWLERAAVEGSAEAQSLVGQMEHDGTALPARDSQERTWLERAAMQGYYRALKLFHLMESFSFGVEETWHHRMPELVQLAIDGDAEAQYQLAQRYDHGTGGVTANLPAARHWYSVAAGAGHKAAMRALSQMLDAGVGGTRDADGARRWASCADGSSPSWPEH